jgi:hypothetical protein
LRKPFVHPDLRGLGELTAAMKGRILSVKRVGILAESYGFNEVIRWKPHSVRFFITTHAVSATHNLITNPPPRSNDTRSKGIIG